MLVQTQDKKTGAFPELYVHDLHLLAEGKGWTDGNKKKLYKSS